jgi:hypothetical protein
VDMVIISHSSKVLMNSGMGSNREGGKEIKLACVFSLIDMSYNELA